MIVTWTYIAIVICLGCWQFFLFVRLLSLAKEAVTDQDRLYSYTTKTNASLINYFSKGILMLVLWGIFIALLNDKENNLIYRQIPSIIFTVTSMSMLAPLQKVAISETYRDYFQRKHRTKYLVTFYIICLMCVIFMVQQFIFIVTFYYDMMNDTNIENTTYTASFSLSFASIGFFIWLFGKYSAILYPVIPELTDSRGDTDKHNATVAATLPKTYGTTAGTHYHSYQNYNIYQDIQQNTMFTNNNQIPLYYEYKNKQQDQENQTEDFKLLSLYDNKDDHDDIGDSKPVIQNLSKINASQYTDNNVSVVLPLIDENKSESILSDDETVATYRTVMTANNFVKTLLITIILIESMGYIVLWSTYIKGEQNEYLFTNSSFQMTKTEGYYWMQIILQTTMIIICMWFFIEFILYTDIDWVKQWKKGNNDDSSICIRLYSSHFKFCCKRTSAMIANIFTLTWSELHILCIITCSYYLLSAILRLYHSNDSDGNFNTNNTALFVVSDGLTAFGLILPPIAYNLCLRVKQAYKQRNIYSKKSRQLTAISIVQVSKSILNNNLIKMWMLGMFSLQLIVFIMEPIVRPDTFRCYLNSLYNCWENEDSNDYVCDSSTSYLVFVIHILILRIWIPLMLLNTVLSFTPKSSHTEQIMSFNRFHYIITPTALIMILLITFVSNSVLFSDYNIITWIYISILLCFALWQMVVFIYLLPLAEDAQNDQEQFFAFTSNVSMFNYFSKGIITLLLWTVSFSFLIYYQYYHGDIYNKIYRQIPSIIFAIYSMYMLVPLQKIVISPTYRNYFRKKQQRKYLVTFHIVCFLSVVFIVQKTIFVATFYYDILMDYNNMKNKMYATSFSLSFASISFFIWLFGKYSVILYPILSSDNSIRNKYKSSINTVRMNKTSKHRKDSKLSLTELYNRHHTLSIPIKSDDDVEEEEEEEEEVPIKTWNDAAKMYGLRSNRSSMSFDDDEKYSHDSDENVNRNQLSGNSQKSNCSINK